MVGDGDLHRRAHRSATHRRLAVEGGWPRSEDRHPLALPRRQRPGVRDVDAGMRARQLTAPEPAGHVVGSRSQLAQLPSGDDAVLVCEEPAHGGRVEIELGHRRRLPAPEVVVLSFEGLLWIPTHRA